MRNGIILAMLAAGFLFSGFFVVDQREVAIVYDSATKIEVFAPGVHWHLPFSGKLNYIYTNLRTSQFGVKLTVNKQPFVLNAVINWQVVKPANYSDYLRKNPQKQRRQGQLLNDYLKSVVTPQLLQVSAKCQSIAQLEEQVNSKLNNLNQEQIGINIMNVGLISISMAESESGIASPNQRLTPVAALESGFKLAGQIKQSADSEQDSELAKLRNKDPRFYDYYLQINHYRQTANTRQDIPALTKLFPTGS